MYRGYFGLLLLMHSSAMVTTLLERRWRCSGSVSEYTNGYCGIKQAIEGCYFADQVKLYKSCGLLCKDIPAPSIDEEKCNAKCPDFLVTYCQLDWLHTSSPPASTQPTMNISSTTMSVNGSTPVVGAMNSRLDNTSLTIGLAVGIVLLVAFLVVVILIVVRKRRRRPPARRDAAASYNANTETVHFNEDQPLSENSHGQPEEVESLLDPPARPDQDDDNPNNFGKPDAQPELEKEEVS